MLVSVPLRVRSGILEPEVAADIDEPAAVGQPPRRLLRSLPGRQRGEHDLGVADLGTDDQRLGCVMEVRLDAPEGLTLMAPRDDRHDLRAGVAQEQPRELASGVAGGPNDRDPSGHRQDYARSWIFMQRPARRPAWPCCDTRLRESPGRR